MLDLGASLGAIGVSAAWLTYLPCDEVGWVAALRRGVAIGAASVGAVCGVVGSFISGAVFGLNCLCPGSFGRSDPLPPLFGMTLAGLLEQAPLVYVLLALTATSAVVVLPMCLWWRTARQPVVGSVVAEFVSAAVAATAIFACAGDIRYAASPLGLLALALIVAAANWRAARQEIQSVERRVKSIETDVEDPPVS